nr:MAG TPA: hypothetical protein [Caudoviricetes sp.]
MKRKKTPALSVREQVAIARDRAVDTTVAIFLTVLCDKEHADAEIIRRVWGEVNTLSDSIREGRVCVKDLKKVLREEYEIGVD